MVIVCVCFDGVNLISECTCVYLYSVTHWGDPPYLQYLSWPIPLSAMLTSLTALVVQSFLIRRYHQLARIRIVTACLAVLAVGAIGGAFGCAILTILHKDFESRKTVTVPAIVWLSLSAGTDCVIAATLIIQLQRMKSGFKKSEGTIRKITVTAIQTGSVTSVVALAALGAFLWIMETNICSALLYCLGCSYTLTMLYNLNQRRSLSGSTSDSESSYRTYSGEPGSLGLNLTGILATDPQSQSDVRMDSDPHGARKSRILCHGNDERTEDVKPVASESSSKSSVFPSSRCIAKPRVSLDH
jgi:hypothetical protein